jgi:hypothetical protein
MKLLEKIEELTLYSVQQAKQLEDRNEAIARLNTRLTSLEGMIERLSRADKQ